MCRESIPLPLALLVAAVGCNGSAPGKDGPAANTTPNTTVISTPGWDMRAPEVQCPAVRAPPQLAEDARWVEVKVRNGVGCAKDRDGLLICFGEGSEALNVQLPSEPVRDFAVGGGFQGFSVVCAILAADGRMECWDTSEELEVASPPPGEGWALLAGDGSGWVAIGADGDLWCWATAGEDGLPGNKYCDKKNVQNAWEIGFYYPTLPVILTADGNLVGRDGELEVPHVGSFGAGDEMLCYTDATTLLPRCFAPSEPQLEWPPSRCPWIALDVRFIYSIGIRTDGTLEAGDLPWDDGMEFPVEYPRGTFVSVSGDSRAGCAIGAQGELACWDYAGVLTRNVPG